MTPCDINNHVMCYGDPSKLDFDCPCPCHDDPDHCAICTNDYADLCGEDEHQ